MKHRGFTLMELLVVIAAVGVIAGIGIPIARSVLAKSREAACLNNLRSLGVGLQSYLQEHQQILPAMAGIRSSKTEETPVLDTVLLPYLDGPEAFKCPQDSKDYEKTGSSYWWNELQNGKHVSKLYLMGIPGDRIPLIADKASWHPSGSNFLYPDMSSSNKLRFAVGN